MRRSVGQPSHRSRPRQSTVCQGVVTMPLVPMRLLLDHAAENDYGLAAFNVNNMEQIQAIMEAARETESPVIVQASRGARSYSQDNYLRHLMLAAAELYPEIPIVMHQDHGNSPATCKSAIENGFTSRDDGRLAQGRRQDAGRLRLQRARHARSVRAGPRQGRLGRRRARLPRLARIAATAKRKTATAPRASCRTISCSPIRTRPSGSSPKRASMRWPSPSAPATARTSSPASRPAKCWRWTASKRSTAGCRTATS